MTAVMRSADASAHPEQIGKYRIVGLLGQGAMGRVYLGEDPHIGRKVAVKVLSGATGDEARARFLEEARTIGNLSHPEIVTLLEFGFHEGQPFLAMEHLGGESFERWLERRPPEAAVLSVLVSLCRAIDHAHSQGVLHRDVKPSNVQVLDGGQAKLLDFGIARAGSVALTATGMLMGTPRYLAPEVLNGEGHSRASDIYAVGLVAYEALTGQNPFAADTLEQCLTRVLTATPEPLATLRPDLEPDLSAAVMACLARRSAGRPATLMPLRQALEARVANASDSLAQATVVIERQGTARTTRRSPAGRPAWLRWAVGGIALLGTAGALAWLLAGHPAVSPETSPRDTPVRAGAVSNPSTPSKRDDGTGGDLEKPESRDATSQPAEDPGARTEPAARPESPPGSPPGSGRTAPAETRPPTGEEVRPAGDTAGRTTAGRTTADRAPSERRGNAAARALQEAGPATVPETGRPRDDASGTRGSDPAASAELASARPTAPADAPPTEDPARTHEQASSEGEAMITSDSARDRAALPEQHEPASSSTLRATGEPDAASARPTASDRTPEGERAAPTAAAPTTPAPQLERVTPAVVRRGAVATVVLDGVAFAEGVTIEVRRGDALASGIRVRRLRRQSDERVRVTLFVAPDVPLGLYSVVVLSPDGRASNPEELEVSL